MDDVGVEFKSAVDVFHCSIGVIAIGSIHIFIVHCNGYTKKLWFRQTPIIYPLPQLPIIRQNVDRLMVRHSDDISRFRRRERRINVDGVFSIVGKAVAVCSWHRLGCDSFVRRDFVGVACYFFHVSWDCLVDCNRCGCCIIHSSPIQISSQWVSWTGNIIHPSPGTAFVFINPSNFQNIESPLCQFPNASAIQIASTNFHISPATTITTSAMNHSLH
mmetsp:Transcript_28346/g.60647  ORF Transcript_28346/g.60647 Transcript_28346/m.60647 type:complete len:217 (-) Transcript_28346:410-1060(-)